MKNIYTILVGKLNCMKLLGREGDSIKIILETMFHKMLGISEPSE
jgi:hypothetical protein